MMDTNITPTQKCEHLFIHLPKEQYFRWKCVKCGAIRRSRHATKVVYPKTPTQDDNAT